LISQLEQRRGITVAQPRAQQRALVQLTTGRLTIPVRYRAPDRRGRHRRGTGLLHQISGLRAVGRAHGDADVRADVAGGAGRRVQQSPCRRVGLGFVCVDRNQRKVGLAAQVPEVVVRAHVPAQAARDRLADELVGRRRLDVDVDDREGTLRPARTVDELLEPVERRARIG
jgi:hypothetical protein